jgi:hypothetical protein
MELGEPSSEVFSSTALTGRLRVTPKDLAAENMDGGGNFQVAGSVNKTPGP